MKVSWYRNAAFCGVSDSFVYTCSKQQDQRMGGFRGETEPSIGVVATTPLAGVWVIDRILLTRASNSGKITKPTVRLQCHDTAKVRAWCLNQSWTLAYRSMSIQSGSVVGEMPARGGWRAGRVRSRLRLQGHSPRTPHSLPLPPPPSGSSRSMSGSRGQKQRHGVTGTKACSLQFTHSMIVYGSHNNKEKVLRHRPSVSQGVRPTSVAGSIFSFLQVVEALWAHRDPCDRR